MPERKKQWSYQTKEMSKTPEQKLIEKLHEALVCKNAQQLSLKLSMDALILVGNPAYQILVEARTQATNGNFEQAIQEVLDLLETINQ